MVRKNTPPLYGESLYVVSRHRHTGPMIVACHCAGQLPPARSTHTWNMLSPVGPALHEDGGSRPRSANSCIGKRQAHHTHLANTFHRHLGIESTMPWRGTREKKRTRSTPPPRTPVTWLGPPCLGRDRHPRFLIGRRRAASHGDQMPPPSPPEVVAERKDHARPSGWSLSLIHI